MARTVSRSLRFTRLELTNWRNFRSVNMELASRAFFVGPNASGKSNLLDVFRFLSEVARPGSGGLRAAVGDGVKGRGGFSAVRSLHARNPPHIVIDAHVGTDDEPERWRYRLCLDVVRPETFPTVKEESVWHNGKAAAAQTRGRDDDALSFAQTLLEDARENQKFRELALFLASCRYLHVVPQIVRDRARARDEGDDPYGGDLLRRMNEMPPKTRDPRLSRISEALQIAVPQFGELKLENDKAGVPHLKVSFVHWRAHASQQSEVAFSDGTLRLIGLLWSIAEKGGPLLLEEPELSLNDAVVCELPRIFARMQKLSGRQVIATTHSMALLEGNGIGLKEVHRVVVEQDGSRVETLADNPQIAAQVQGGMTIGEALFPLLRPPDVEALGTHAIAG